MSQPNRDAVIASDAQALSVAQAQGLSAPQMRELWLQRWKLSGALQAEFSTAETYAAYMQGLASGRIKQRSRP